MKHVSKLPVKIVVIATIVGFLFASIGVGITHTATRCTATDTPKGEFSSHCVSINKTFMHPNDLLHNKQNSLIRFSETFIVVSLATFALLSAFSLVHKKAKKARQ